MSPLSPFIPNVRPCTSLLTYLSSPPLSESRVSYKRHCQVDYPFPEITAADHSHEKLSSSSEVFFSFLSFISACLMVSHFQYCQVYVRFLFSERSNSFLISSGHCRFLFFIMSMDHFPNSFPISWVYILIVCIRVSNSFSFFLQTASWGD